MATNDDLQRAEDLERRGDVKAALRAYRDALLAAETPEQRASVLVLMGRCLLETELDEAADRLAEARKEAETCGSEELLGRVDLVDARLAMVRGRHRAASERLDSARRRLAGSADLQIEIEILAAGAERHRGELARSEARLRALDTAEIEARPLLHAEFLDELGATLIASGDYQSAVDVLNDAVALDHRLNPSDYASARSRLLLAEALMGRGDRRRSKQLIEEVRDSVSGSTSGLSEVHALRGRWFEEGNEFALAARDYRTGLDIDRESDDEIGVIRALRRLARVRRKQGNISSAEVNLEEAWNLARGNDDDVIKFGIYLEQGELALDETEYTVAIEKFGLALRIAEEDEDDRSIAIAKRRLANAHSEDGDQDQAERLLREARTVLEHRGDLRELNELLDDLGAVLIEQDEYLEAIEMLNASLEIDERLGTISSRARSLQLLSRAYARQGDRVRAGACIRDAAAVYQDTEDEVNRSDVLADLGAWQMQEGRLREARSTFQEALRLDSRHDDTIGMVRSLRGLGGVYRAMGDLVRARESLDDAREYLKTKNDRAEQALLDLEIGRLLAEEGSVDEAERQLQTAMERFTALDSPVDAATCKRLLGQLLGQQGGSKGFLALELLNDARAVFEKYHDAPELDQLFDDLGQVYLRMGLLGEAETAVRESLRLGDTNNWQHGRGASLILMGKIDLARDRQGEARRNFEEALRAFEEIEDDAGISNARLELGDLAVAEGQPDEALAHYRAARQIDQSLRDLRGLARVFRKLGDVYFLRGEFERAEEAYDQAAENLRALRDPRQEALLALSRGTLAAQLGDHHAAISSLERALARFRETDDSERTASTYRLLAASYHALGRFDDAIACLREMGLEQASLWNSLLQNFTPAVSEPATGKFLAQEFDDAVKAAFTSLEGMFRTRDGDPNSTRSMTGVIDDWVTVERRGLAPFVDERELSQFKNLCMGAFAVIRNRVTHGRWHMNSTDAMAALGVAHLIAELIDAPAPDVEQ